MRSVTTLPLFIQAFLAFAVLWGLAASAAALVSPPAVQPLALVGLLIGVPWALWCAVGLLIQWLVGLARKPS